MVNSQLLALFLFGKPYAALLAQELHGFGIVVAALLAVLECPRQRLVVVVYALLHAAEYLHLIDGFDAQAEVFLHELLVYDGAAYAHAHGAYLQIGLWPRMVAAATAALPKRSSFSFTSSGISVT